MFLSPPDVGADDRNALVQAFDSNWIAPVGPDVDGFEREFAEALEVPHALALSSGTAALHLALIACGVDRDSDVITSTLTFAATANAITYVGARPVFIDVCPATWTIDPELLDTELAVRALEGRPAAAVIAVDLYGQCADYARITEICRRYDTRLIADAAESLGSTYGAVRAGSLGDCAAFSFNGNKIITTSGGGMLVSHDRRLIDRARHLSAQARDPAPHYQHSSIGYNYRLSNLLAALGRAQLRSLPEKVARRRAVNARYRSAFDGVPGMTVMPEAAYGTSNCWLTCITVDEAAFGSTADVIRLALDKHDIESRPIWKPMHLQPVFQSCPIREGGVAEDLFRRGLCLPSGSSLSGPDQSRVIDIVTTLAAA